jgi:SAM-dependent methyltransferase
MKESPAHNDVIRESFTTQAAAFAATPWVSDEERISRLVSAAQLTGNERVLDIATGPGYIAEAFARSAREVIGIDLTEAMLAIARERTALRRVANVSFQIADAQHLPFADGYFDVVVCRFAIHHLENPLTVVREMIRVCRVNGTVLVEDLFASEHPARADYYNHFERLRDPSHVRSLPLSELLHLLRDAGLETEAVTMNNLFPEVEHWLTTTRTPPDRASTVRRLLEEDRLHDLSGTRPFHDAAGHLCFRVRAAILTGRKFSPLP